MDSALRDRIRGFLGEDEPSRPSKLRKDVKRVLASGKGAQGTSQASLASRQPPPAAHSAPPLEQGHGDREVLQMAGADLDSP